PGPPVFLPAELDVRNFDAGGGSLIAGFVLITGYVADINDNLYDPLDPLSTTPYLPDGLNIHNCCAAANDYFTALFYGNSIDFQINLTWTPGAADSPSAFYFTMFDQFGAKAFSNAPDLFLQAMELNLNPDQSVTAVTYASEVQATGPPPTGIPEPSTMLP